MFTSGVIARSTFLSSHLELRCGSRGVDYWLANQEIGQPPGRGAPAGGDHVSPAFPDCAQVEHELTAIGDCCE